MTTTATQRRQRQRQLIHKQQPHNTQTTTQWCWFIISTRLTGKNKETTMSMMVNSRPGFLDMFLLHQILWSWGSWIFVRIIISNKSNIQTTAHSRFTIQLIMILLVSYLWLNQVIGVSYRWITGCTPALARTKLLQVGSCLPAMGGWRRVVQIRWNSRWKLFDIMNDLVM